MSAYWAGATPAAVKAYLDSSIGSSEDQLLQTLADAAAAGIESYLNRTIQQRAVTARLDGNGKAALMWPEYPVTAVSLVQIDGQAVEPAADTDYSSDGYRFDTTRLVLQGGRRFTPGMLNVQLAFTAGFATIPDDLLQACVESAALKYRQRQSVGVSSKSLAGETISFVQTDFPQSALRIMRNYKRVVPW